MSDIVDVIPYNPQWPELFRKTALPIRGTVGPVAIRIDHIGSTAIKGMFAKPIIDIQISVASFEMFDCVRVPLEYLGHILRSENPDLTKRYFREPPGMPRTHIHVRQRGSWSEQFALLFRDYMRTHEQDAVRYSELKSRLAKEYREDRQGYTDAKSSFIWEVIARASEWSQLAGWQPGASDV